MHHSIEFLGISEIQERKFPGCAMKLFDDQGFSSNCSEFSKEIHQMSEIKMRSVRKRFHAELN